MAVIATQPKQKKPSHGFHRFHGTISVKFVKSVAKQFSIELGVKQRQIMVYQAISFVIALDPHRIPIVTRAVKNGTRFGRDGVDRNAWDSALPKWLRVGGAA